MSKKVTPSQRSPFIPFGEQIGSGKDNKVVELEYSDSRPVDASTGLRVGERVVKISTEANKGKFLTPEQAFADARFKQAKYQLLRHFLGEYIPRTSFVVGEKTNQADVRSNKSYTVQDRVPQYMISDLDPEQRNSDELRSNMFGLVTRLQTMHKTLDRARTIIEGHGREFLIDAALDLGPLSRYVREHIHDDPNEFNYAHMITGYKASPNLLVDPSTLDVHCIDFGQGQWTPELGAQMALVYDITAHDPETSRQLPQQSS